MKTNFLRVWWDLRFFFSEFSDSCFFLERKRKIAFQRNIFLQFFSQSFWFWGDESKIQEVQINSSENYCSFHLLFIAPIEISLKLKWFEPLQFGWLFQEKRKWKITIIYFFSSRDDQSEIQEKVLFFLTIGPRNFNISWIWQIPNKKFSNYFDWF